jgi:hypothetical protein
VEIDEQGRPVHRPPPPGHREAGDGPEAFPTFEHNQWSFEGEIERLGAFARGVHRARGLPRRVGVLLAVLVGLPFAIGIVLLGWQVVFG